MRKALSGALTENIKMERQILQVGSFEVNCSLVIIGARAWIVDPGADAPRLVETLAARQLEPAGILLTHGHFDHIGAIPALQAAFPGLQVHVNPEDARMLAHPLNQFPPDYPPIAMPANIRTPADAEAAFAAAGARLEVIDTPGHTPGGVCYHLPEEKLLFAGDTLFAGSAGRTDLPGGDMATLMDSLHRLLQLADETVVIPGHGPATTIGRERATNPFLI